MANAKSSKHLVDAQLLPFLDALPKFDLSNEALPDIRRGVEEAYRVQAPPPADNVSATQMWVPGHGDQPWRNREDHDRSGVWRAERSIPVNPTAPRTDLYSQIDGGGTVPPELAAVRRLIDRGHTVEVLAEHPATAGVKD